MLSGALSLCALLLLAGTGLARNPHLIPGGTPEWIRFTIVQLDLVEENVVAAWLSSLLFLLLTPAAAACFLADRLRTGGIRLGSLGWLVLAGVGLLVSVSELGSLHETSHEIVSGPFSDWLQWWVAPLAIPIVVVLVLLVWFIRTWLREHRRAFWLVSAGVLLYASVPIQEQMEGMMRDRAVELHGVFWRPLPYIWLEEGAELFGTIFLLAGIGFYLLSTLGAWPRSEVSSIRWRGGEGLRVEVAEAGRTSRRGDGAVTGTVRVSARVLLGALAILVALLALGMGAGAVLLEVFSYAREFERQGELLNWFPSMLAGLSGLACIYGSRVRSRLPTEGGSLRAPLLVAGLYALLVSMDIGVDRAFSGELWEGNPRWQAAVDLGFAGVAALCFGLLWRASRGARVPFAFWASALAALYLLRPSSGAAVLALLAFAGFAFGMALLWAERFADPPLGGGYAADPPTSP